MPVDHIWMFPNKPSRLWNISSKIVLSLVGSTSKLWTGVFMFKLFLLDMPLPSLKVNVSPPFLRHSFSKRHVLFLLLTCTAIQWHFDYVLFMIFVSLSFSHLVMHIVCVCVLQ